MTQHTVFTGNCQQNASCLHPSPHPRCICNPRPGHLQYQGQMSFQLELLRYPYSSYDTSIETDRIQQPKPQPPSKQQNARITPGLQVPFYPMFSVRSSADRKEQTFAVFKTNHKYDFSHGAPYGTCQAYTCTAPTETELTADEDCWTFFWKYIMSSLFIHSAKEMLIMYSVVRMGTPPAPAQDVSAVRTMEVVDVRVQTGRLWLVRMTVLDIISEYKWC